MLEEHQELAYGKTRDIIDGILLSANDTQTLNGMSLNVQCIHKLSIVGIALLISGLSQIKILDLYHLHILYDTVSFTG